MGKLLGGVGLLILALFMLLGFFRAQPSAGTAATIVTFLLAVVLPAAGGVALLYAHRQQGHSVAQRKERLRQQTLEAEMLKLAARKGGKLTVVEVIGEMAVIPRPRSAAWRRWRRRATLMCSSPRPV